MPNGSPHFVVACTFLPRRAFVSFAVLGLAFGLLAGCSSRSESKREEATVIVREPELTAELAKKALLDRMRSGVFDSFDPNEWANVEMRAGEDGWYDFGGLFHINPLKKMYTMLIVPRPEVKACTFSYEGTFSVKEGRWEADLPKLVGTALGGGN